MFRRIGILGHPLRPQTAEVCDRVASSLQRRGIPVWCEAVWDAVSVRPRAAESDLIIAIGGDGSMLRAARLASRFDVPVFGINAGQLGFLTETSLDDWDQALDVLVRGDYWVERRMMIRCEAWRGDTLLHAEDALNDVVVSRGAVARSILLETYIDGGWTTTYNADGLIIATPTGSTAYSLAVGGPILPPALQNILVTPVAPHLSLDRPLVLSVGATVEVIIAQETSASAILTVDGETLLDLERGDSVTVQSSEYSSQFVRLRERNYFYRSLLDRMEPRAPTRQHMRPPARRHIDDV